MMLQILQPAMQLLLCNFLILMNVSILYACMLLSISMYFLYISTNSMLFADMYRKYIEIVTAMCMHIIIQIHSLVLGNYIHLQPLPHRRMKIQLLFYSKHRELSLTNYHWGKSEAAQHSAVVDYKTRCSYTVGSIDNFCA